MTWVGQEGGHKGFEVCPLIVSQAALFLSLNLLCFPGLLGEEGHAWAGIPGLHTQPQTTE